MITLEASQRSSRRAFITGASALATLPFAGRTARAAGPEPLKVQLSWLKNVESAPQFVAQKQGYFAQAGLAVDLLAGGPQVDPVALVASGAVDLAVASSALAVVAARSRGVPLKVIGCGYQKSALGLAARADKNLTLPQGLKGAHIGYQQVNRSLMRALLKANAIPETSVTTSVVTADPTLLIEGKIDLMTVSVLNVPTTMKTRGVEPATWLAYDLGVPMQGLIYVCLADTLAKRQTAIARYMQALAKGYTDTIEKPDEAADLTTREFGEALDEATQRAYNRAQGALMRSPDTAQHGLLWINPEAWRQTSAAAVATEVISEPVDLGALLATDFYTGLNLPKA